MKDNEDTANPALSALSLLRGIVWNFLSILTVSAVGVGLLLYAASHTQNSTAVSASEKLLAAVLDDDKRNLSRLAKDYANWDDAIRHLLTELNEPWAEKNIGAYLSKTFDLSVAAAISGNDDTIVAAIDGKIARDAMPDGGRIEIEAANVHLDETFSSRRRYEVAVGDYVAIAVRDTGAGMSSATIENAFVPFFTTKEVGKGSGLGLSMVFGFVQRHSGGYVEIESAPGGGTTVWLYFPRAEDGVQKAA